MITGKFPQESAIGLVRTSVRKSGALKNIGEESEPKVDDGSLACAPTRS